MKNTGVFPKNNHIYPPNPTPAVPPHHAPPALRTPRRRRGAAAAAVRPPTLSPLRPQPLPTLPPPLSPAIPPPPPSTTALPRLRRLPPVVTPPGAALPSTLHPPPGHPCRRLSSPTCRHPSSPVAPPAAVPTSRRLGEVELRMDEFGDADELVALELVRGRCGVCQRRRRWRARSAARSRASGCVSRRLRRRRSASHPPPVLPAGYPRPSFPPPVAAVLPPPIISPPPSALRHAARYRSRAIPAVGGALLPMASARLRRRRSRPREWHYRSWHWCPLLPHGSPLPLWMMMLLAAAAAAWRVEALSVKATDTECIDESVPYEGDTVSGTSSSSCTTSTGVPTIPASTSRCLRRSSSFSLCF